jgi:hypothetical protein
MHSTAAWARSGPWPSRPSSFRASPSRTSPRPCAACAGSTGHDGTHVRARVDEQRGERDADVSKRSDRGDGGGAHLRLGVFRHLGAGKASASGPTRRAHIRTRPARPARRRARARRGRAPASPATTGGARPSIRACGAHTGSMAEGAAHVWWRRRGREVGRVLGGERMCAQREQQATLRPSVGFAHRQRPLSAGPSADPSRDSPPQLHAGPVNRRHRAFATNHHLLLGSRLRGRPVGHR